MIRSRKLFVSCALASILCLTSAAQAVPFIDNGAPTGNLNPFGPTNTETYGETFRPSAPETALNDFTFHIKQTSGGPLVFQGFVQAFNTATKLATGPVLFTSGAVTDPFGNDGNFHPFTINTGSLVLTPGSTFVAYLSTSNESQTLTGSEWALTGSVATPNNEIVYNNNGANSALLETSTWSTRGQTFQFHADFSPPGGGGAAPEIDADSAITPVALMFGLFAILSDRRKRIRDKVEA